MKDQNYSNHARFVKGFHFILSSILLIGVISSFVNIWFQWSEHYDLLTPVLVTVLFICCFLLAAFTRSFPLKAQDRAIRAEENLRYFILTRKALDNRITMQQVIALRFAPDEEFVQLADRAVAESLTADEIKKAIKSWKADQFRV